MFNYGYTDKEYIDTFLKFFGIVILAPICIVGMLLNASTFYFGLFCLGVMLFCGVIILVRFLLKK